MQEAIASDAQEVLGAGMPIATDLARMTEPVAIEVMRFLYSNAGGTQPGLSRAHLSSMLKLARGGRGGRGVDLPGGLRFRIVGQHMEFVAPASSTEIRPRLDVKHCNGGSDPEAAQLAPGPALRLGVRPPALRLRSAGGAGYAQLPRVLGHTRVPP